MALRLIYHAMNAYGGVEVHIAPFLALALDWESGWLHAAAALVLVKVPRFPLHRTAGISRPAPVAATVMGTKYISPPCLAHTSLM